MGQSNKTKAFLDKIDGMYHLYYDELWTTKEIANHYNDPEFVVSTYFIVYENYIQSHTVNA